ncbi:MAG: hypothetical protein EU539_01810 [Promethearchaeota archaeon]|nr:MAG: hypothetical protein EU539_01810 [Candidatus Lokiarchaeota archaeon]
MTLEKTPHRDPDHLKLNVYPEEKSRMSFDESTILKCDACYSTEITETKEGYVCRSCGVVLEIQKYVYNRPYNANIIQHARLGITQIGTVKERVINENSIHLNNLNKLHSIQSNENAVLDQAKIELSRIFNCLNLPSTMKDIVLEKFRKIRACLKPGTKYRSPEKLIPIAIYHVFKFRNISISEAELLEVSKIAKKDFNAFKLQIRTFFPQYKERDRKKYILQKVLEITEYFETDMPFYYLSKKILYKLWDHIKNTKDNVIAGLVASISALCLCKDKISVSSICDKLDIKMSTIQSQVKKKIFKQFKVPGFTTLVRSSEALKKIIKKMGLLEHDDQLKFYNQTKSPGINEILIEKDLE